MVDVFATAANHRDPVVAGPKISVQVQPVAPCGIQGVGHNGNEPRFISRIDRGTINGAALLQRQWNRSLELALAGLS